MAPTRGATVALLAALALLMLRVNGIDAGGSGANGSSTGTTSATTSAATTATATAATETTVDPRQTTCVAAVKLGKLDECSPNNTVTGYEKGGKPCYDAACKSTNGTLCPANETKHTCDPWCTDNQYGSGLCVGRHKTCCCLPDPQCTAVATASTTSASTAAGSSGRTGTATGVTAGTDTSTNGTTEAPATGGTSTSSSAGTTSRKTTTRRTKPPTRPSPPPPPPTQRRTDATAAPAKGDDGATSVAFIVIAVVLGVLLAVAGGVALLVYWLWRNSRRAAAGNPRGVGDEAARGKHRGPAKATEPKAGLMAKMAKYRHPTRQEGRVVERRPDQAGMIHVRDRGTPPAKSSGAERTQRGSGSSAELPSTHPMERGGAASGLSEMQRGAGRVQLDQQPWAEMDITGRLEPHFASTMSEPAHIPSEALGGVPHAPGTVPPPPPAK